MSGRQGLLFAAILVLCVSCDHGAKRLAGSELAAGAPVSLFADVLRLELVRNPGAFLSAGASLPPPLRHALFLVAVPLALAGVCALALRAGLPSRASLLGLALLAGGGLGNWIDRLLNDGAVTDFVSIGVGALRTGIFNVADVCVVAGAALLLLGARGRAEGARAPAPPGA